LKTLLPNTSQSFVTDLTLSYRMRAEPTSEDKKRILFFKFENKICFRNKLSQPYKKVLEETELLFKHDRQNTEGIHR
jgi:hypothetical protein